MKSIKFIALLLIAFVFQAKAQTATVSPSSFNATQRITITYDLTGTILENVSPIYLWAWAPGVGDCPTNGQWSASGEGNIMSQPTPGVPIWTISFVPTSFYKIDAGKFTQLGCLAKAKDGTGDKKTKDFVFDVNPLKFEPTILRTFPTKFGADDILTLVYTQSIDTAAASVTKALTEPYLFIEYQLVGSGSYTPIHPYTDDFTQYPELKLKAGTTTGTFTLTNLLKTLITLKPGEKLDKVRLKIRSADGVSSYPVGPGAGLNKTLLK